jgi:hypothetical protein
VGLVARRVYVGNYGYNRLGGFQGGTQQNLNQINLGAAYLPRTRIRRWCEPERHAGLAGLPARACCGRSAGIGSIGQHTTEFYDKYHSIQTSFNRRFRGGMSFGVNYTWSILLEGNTGLQIYTGDPGSGCSSNQYRQFNTAAVMGPSFQSVGLESGRNIMRGCPEKFVDLAISRDIRMGGNRTFEIRLDVFNVFDTVVYTGRSTTIQFNNPAAQTQLNPQYLPDGTLNPQRLTPRTAGFGAATNAAALRSMQLQFRFSF